MLTAGGNVTTMGFAPAFTISNRIATELTRIERARGFLEAATLSEGWVREMAHRAFVLEAHHTTHIEGTRLTVEQSEGLLDGKEVPAADPDDARELLNYREAFDFVSEYVAAGGPVIEGVIREIHRRLVAGVRGGSAAPGEYRRIQNAVVNSATGEIVYTPPPAYDVPVLMAELVQWLNNIGDTHPVIVSGIAQFQLVTSTRSWMATAGRPGSCRRCACIGRATTSNGYSPSASATTATVPPSIKPSRAFAPTAWT